MTNQIKNVTDRLVDGFNDYFNNVESFDGRYVCGQLFLYGKAKAYDVGMPGQYNGEDKVKINYMLNWFNNLWEKADKELLEVLSRAHKYDSFEDSVISSLGKLYRPIDTGQYVQILNALIEAQQFLKLNDIQSTEYHNRIGELEIAEVTPTRFTNMHLVLGNLLNTIQVRLEKDYDGEQIYPSATMTMLTAIDHLKNDAFAMIKYPPALPVIKINDTVQFTPEYVTQTFCDMPVNVLLDKHIPEALVLGLKNHLLLEKSIKHVNKVITLMETILSTLLKE